MLDLRGVTVTFGGATAVDRVDLSVADGAVLAVLGPSGCGKSTLLRAVAGLEPLAAGRIAWDGADLAGTPTHRRGFALMFQDGQLFDHLTVARNVGYARRLQGVSRSVVRTEVADLLDLVGLGGYADRLPRTLSGGERQRVALARSLAARPRLLLLDEPLSALDTGLRGRLAADLRRILVASGTTALLVTHDQDEAFAVADRLAVMRDGRIVQEGATGDVWAHPADADTALFLGYGRVLEGEAAATLLRRAGLPSTAGAVALRPTAVWAGPDPSEGGSGIPAVVRSFRPAPDAGRLVVAVEGVGELDAVGAPGWVTQPGRRVVVRVERHAIAVLTGGATNPAGGAP
ncbi:ABC transporter ATP-binding protein [Nocardioides sp. BYT-33-1]|uniref:ABC transporter ATP-binding protein n=1 Tax=Nocardioides sp. BYT-33-1 TaxID=3416952 RepID=UPI003F5321AB